MECIGSLESEEIFECFKSSIYIILIHYLRSVYSVRDTVSGSGDKMTDKSDPISVLVDMSGTVVGGGITSGKDVERTAQ